jgi:hypothetical protein
MLAKFHNFTRYTFLRALRASVVNLLSPNVSHLTSPCDLRHFVPGINWPRIELSFGAWWMFQPQRNSIRDGETWGKS